MSGNDKRFSKVSKDPIFMSIPKQVRKTKITDERFTTKLKSAAFRNETIVDEYGRKIDKSP